jgi:Taurine catabolism dioxygenase TauD, TfdA family
MQSDRAMDGETSEWKDGWVASSFSFDQYRVELSPGSLEQLRHILDTLSDEQITHERLHARYGQSQLMTEVTGLRTRYVDHGPGYVVVAGLGSIDGSRRKSAFRTLSLCVAPMQFQNDRGMEIKEVQDRGTAIGEGATSWYSDSRYGGSLHTDGAKSASALPHYFTLFCERQAGSGGATQLVSVQALFQHLTRHRPEVIDVLKQPFYFHLRGDSTPDGQNKAAKPVFFREDGRICISYLREYIEAGHAEPDVPDLSPAQVDALDAIDAYLDDPAHRVAGYMQPGDTIIVNNKIILHGRSEYEPVADASAGRLLYRIWLQKATHP